MEEATSGAGGTGDDEEARRQRKRSRNTELQRALRAARRAQGLCTQCAKPNQGTGAKCDDCAEKGRAYTRRYQAARAAERERLHQETRNAPGGPFCHHCGGNDLTRAGRAQHSGEQRYRCRACKRQSYGRNPVPRIDPLEDRRCPNRRCSGQCVKDGKDRKGRQQYFCRKCGRSNTVLWPSDVRSPGGPFPHKITLYLSLTAERALNDYLQKHTMSPAQAVRAIFRPWADEPLVALAREVDAWGDPIGPPPPKPLPREDVNTRLIDTRRQATLKRMRLSDGNRLHNTVLVTWKLSLALDDTALQGLLRYMRKTGLEHQDAARAMIVAARPVDARP